MKVQILKSKLSLFQNKFHFVDIEFINNISSSIHSFSLPHRDRGLSGSHTTRTDVIWCTGLTTVTLQFQADETELNVAARTLDIFTVLLAVFHLHPTCRTGSDRGAVCDPLHSRQTDALTCVQKLQVSVHAAVIVTAVRSRAWTFPLPLTLPAELVGLLLVSCADGAPRTQVGQILPLHTGSALWALRWETVQGNIGQDLKISAFDFVLNQKYSTLTTTKPTGPLTG